MISYKKIVFFTFFSVFFLFINSCRYKDNDNLSLLSVKKRLNRTWQLQSALLVEGSVDLIERSPDIKNEELQIQVFNNEELILATKYMSVGFTFKNNKKEIYYGTGDDGNKNHFTITKLTHKELWLEGNPTMGICNGNVGLSNYVKLKYHAKE